MKAFAMLKFTTAICLNLAFILTACNNGNASKPKVRSETSTTDLPPLTDYITCLPQKAALVAAHRGTAKRTKYPENSMSALKALMDKGYLVAEVDIAALKDGTHILYHDGVWNEKSTGEGSVSSSTWDKAEKILLTDTNGRVSSDRPVKFEDYLTAAKGQIYLEIDFKSSSKYKTVIDLIREHKMSDQVILISYNEGQTRKLSSLAPDMIVSVGPDEALEQKRFKPRQVAAWLGYDLNNETLTDKLRKKGVPILGRIKKDWNSQAAEAADILVTDNIFDLKPIIGLTKKGKAQLENCLLRL